LENNRALEPDYVLIKNVPIYVDEEYLRVKNITLAKLDKHVENVAIHKVSTGVGFNENFCILIFDFKGSIITK
jgi:hypothetical protein